MSTALAILAIWGALLSTALGALQILAYRRDRPQLHLAVKATSAVGHLPWIGVEVANRGRQPTTLMEVGFFVDVHAEVQGNEGVALAVRPKIVLDGAPRLVAPGDVATFRRELSEWPGITHADDPLRAYAVDSHGRIAWGAAMPLLRLVLSDGWQPALPDPRLVEPIPGPRLSTPVEPRWKLWVDRELRVPTDVSLDAWMAKRRDPEVTFGARSSSS